MSLTPLRHIDLSEVTEDQHHPKKHALGSLTEHTGKLPESNIQYQNPPLHTHPNIIKVKGENQREKSPHSIIEFRGTGGTTATVTEEPRSDKTIITLSSSMSSTQTPPNYDEFLLQEFFIEGNVINMYRWVSTVSPPTPVTTARCGLSYPSNVITDLEMISTYFNRVQKPYVRFRVYKTDYNSFAVFFSDSGLAFTNVFGFVTQAIDSSINGVIIIGGAMIFTPIILTYPIPAEYVVEFWLDSSYDLQVSINGATSTNCGAFTSLNDVALWTYGGNDGAPPDESILRNLTVRANWAGP